MSNRVSKLRKAPRRVRPIYGVLIVLVVMAGLASRSALARYLPVFIADYSGDTLWALGVFLGLAFVFPRTPTSVLAVLALVVSFGVEFSQLYHADWINALRRTRLGALILGSGFLWSDLVCYTVGIGIGVGGDIVAGTLRSDDKVSAQP